MSNVGKVERIYHALSRGDFRAVLPWLAEGVAWDVWESNMAQAAGVSHLQPRKGPLGVLQYFQILARWEVREFRVVSLMEGGNQVAAEVVFEARLPGGRTLRDEEVHLWTFDVDGKVARFRHYVDTAKHMAAAGLLVQGTRRPPPPAASARAPAS